MTEFNIDDYKASIASIDLLECSYSVPNVQSGNSIDTHLENHIEVGLGADGHSLIIMCTVHIKLTDKKITAAKLRIGSIYKIEMEGKEPSLKIKEQSQIPETLIQSLITETVSITRGIMYSQFKGTSFEKVYLPLTNDDGKGEHPQKEPQQAHRD